MPTYSYRCSREACGHKFERILPMREFQTPQNCDKCGADGIRILVPVAGFVQGDYHRYRCPVTGKPITSRKEHEENLKRTGCRLLEAGEKEDNLRERAREERAFDREVDSFVDSVFEQLPQGKKDQLVHEVNAGFEAVVTRESVTS